MIFCAGGVLLVQLIDRMFVFFVSVANMENVKPFQLTECIKTETYNIAML